MIAPAAFLFIFLASYCNAGDVNTTHISADFDDDTYSSYDDMPKLDDTNYFGPNASRDFYIVVIIGLLSLLLNLFGSLYIVFRTYLQLRRGGRDNVPLSLRFPFYLALTDVFLSLSNTINLSYTLVWKLPWSNPACKIIGTSGIAIFVLNIFLVGIVALTTWCFVCREYYIEFGPYDYKLWIVSLLLSAIVAYLAFGNAGQQKYWCAGKHHSNTVPIIMIAVNIVILITILTCYTQVLLKIRNSDTVLLQYQRAPIERRALRKLISYIFTFTLQFIPIIIYNALMIFGIENLLLDVLAISTINFGGIGNFIQFAINEGLTYSTKLVSTSSIEQHAAVSAVQKDNISIKITTSEVKDIVVDDRSNINNESNLTSETVANNNNLLSPKNEKSNHVKKEIDIDEIAIDDDDTLNATTLVSVNSSKVLLNNDDE